MMLTLSQACDRIGVAVQTVRQWRWRKNKRLPLHQAGRDFLAIMRQHGRVLRVDEDDLEQWVEARRTEAREKPVSNDDELSPDLRNMARKLELAGYKGAAQAVNGIAEMVEEGSQ